MFQRGLKGVVAVRTAIASVDGEKGELRYRGRDIRTLVQEFGFEQLAYLLWHGRTATPAELAELEKQLIHHRQLPAHTVEVAKALPPGAPLMDNLRTLVSSYSHEAFKTLSTDEQSIALTAALPVMIALLYKRQQGEATIKPREDLAHTANYLWMLSGKLPSPAQIEALETYWKLTMEHGLNASTFAARVTISTESDLVSAITSAIGTMKGPLHGGAPSGVIDLLEEIRVPEAIRPVIQQKLKRGEKIMGFGHRIYRTEDPRSLALREKCLALHGSDPWLDLATAAEQEITQLLNEHKPGRALHTNVEFYAAAIMRAIDMPPALFTPTFSAARIVGWTAHAAEQQRDNVIFRPESEYIGTIE